MNTFGREELLKLKAQVTKKYNMKAPDSYGHHYYSGQLDLIEMQLDIVKQSEESNKPILC